MIGSAMQETIAGQVHHMKPDHMKPGVDVAMVPGEDDNTLRVFVNVRGDNGKAIDISYDDGPDLYNVKVHDAKLIGGTVFTSRNLDDPSYEGIFCDQLGEICFGNEAKPWTQPFGEVITWDAEGNEERTQF